MNTDYLPLNKIIRQKRFNKNIKSSGDSRYYSDSCDDIYEYAKEQNTIYDPKTNQMLYGISTNTRVAGVSDGTCNQYDPLLKLNHYKCGSGSAGGNRCVADAYGIENFASGCFRNNNDYIYFIILVVFFIFVLYTKSEK
jgi:hypothetical protein